MSAPVFLVQQTVWFLDTSAAIREEETGDPTVPTPSPIALHYVSARNLDTALEKGGENSKSDKIVFLPPQ